MIHRPVGFHTCNYYLKVGFPGAPTGQSVFTQVIITLRLDSGDKQGSLVYVAGLGLIDWCLTPFLTIVQLYHGGQFTSHAFPGFLTPVLHTTNFPSNRLLFYIDIAHWWKTNDALTFVNRRKESWPSRDSNSQPPGLTARVATD